MTRNLKALGLALVAILAMGVVVAQGASAAETKHEFHADGEKTIVTGTNSIIGTNGKGETETQLSVHEFAVGGAGTVKCNKVETESTQVGTKVGTETYAAATITVVPRYEECTFAGGAATVNFNHCAYVFYGQTTLGNPTDFPKEGTEETTKEEHANVEIECSGGSVVEVDTSLCTITVGPQLIKHAVRYENDKHNSNAVNVIATAHKVVTGKKKTTESQTGCLLFPTGEIGKYTGTTTGTCFRDDSLTTPKETEATTPKGLTKEGPQTRCTVSPGA